MPTSGDIQEIKFSHPDLGDFVFYPVANEDATWDYGAFITEDDDDAIDGGGRALYVKRRKRPMVEVPVSWDMEEVDELNALKSLAENSTPSDVTVSHTNGQVFGFTGKPVGDLQGNMGTGRIDLKISGQGRATKVV